MKLKQTPDDFLVEERTDVSPSDRGDFAFYRLEKRNWTTPDALAVLRRRWTVHPDRIAYGGLKDRHAATMQYLTIYRGPRRNLSQQGISVTYLGQVEQPYSSANIRANFFRLVMRAVHDEQARAWPAVLDEIRLEGVPNYFDDQRFGSVGESGDFIAKLLVLGRHEEALKQALTAPYEFDRAAQKREKALLRSHWGDWPLLKERLPRGHPRSLVDYLVSHPDDFRGAIERLRPELGGLYLSAFQSHLWNRTLALFLSRSLRPEQLFPVMLRMGEVPFHRGLDADQRAKLSSATIPLASARAQLSPDDPLGDLVHEVVRGEGLELEQMKIKGSRLFFSRGDRPALCLPRELEATTDDDERHPGKKKVRLSFELPRGSYATLIVKRLTSVDSTQ